MLMYMACGGASVRAATTYERSGCVRAKYRPRSSIGMPVATITWSAVTTAPSSVRTRQGEPAFTETARVRSYSWSPTSRASPSMYFTGWNSA